MKKAFFVLVAAACGVIAIAPLSFSRQVEYTNVVDEKGYRQGAWRITAAMMKFTDWGNPDQVVKEGNYFNNEPTGTWIEYDKYGSMVTKTQYDTSMNHALMERFVDGIRVAESNFIDGWHDGIEKTYYPDGTLQSEYTWKNGRLNGPAKTYYPNGKLCEEGTWFHGYWDMTQPYTFHKK